MRQDFTNRANQLFKERQGQYSKTEGQFKDLSRQYGFDSSKVVLDFNSQLPAATDRDMTGSDDLKSKYGLE